MNYGGGITPAGQHFAQWTQRRHVDCRYCSAARRSDTSLPSPFSGIDARSSRIIGPTTSAWQAFRPIAAAVRRTSARDSTSIVIQSPSAAVSQPVRAIECLISDFGNPAAVTNVKVPGGEPAACAILAHHVGAPA